MRKIFLSLMFIVFFACQKNEPSVLEKKIKSISVYSASRGENTASIYCKFNENGQMIQKRNTVYNYNQKGYLSSYKEGDDIYGKETFLIYDNLDRLIRTESVFGDNSNAEVEIKINYKPNSFVIVYDEGVGTEFLYNDKNLYTKAITFDESNDNQKYYRRGFHYFYDDLENLVKEEFIEYVGTTETDINGEKKLEYSFSYEYDSNHKNIFDSSTSLKGKTGLFDISPFISASPRERLYMFSKNAILESNNVHEFDIEVGPRNYLYEDGLLKEVRISHDRIDDQIYVLSYY